MTNTGIIMRELESRGITEGQISQLLAAYGDIPFHTAQVWSRMGYQLKAGAEPDFVCHLWKHTNKPNKAAIAAAESDGEEISEDPHFYRKLSNIYGPDKVEKSVPAPDLETVKQRLGQLAGLTLTVKGAKTAAPCVWVSGNVAAHEDTIKANGGKWSAKKSAWYIKPAA